ncbi:major facilitator superfamily protein [Spathaspora passalidarum NRRL Y-27907]|uniref:GPI ethanolamine phosphate transferase 2 n=1 Tax=Spathaspora passalidarum (strain NRRL Y-27907 / 11-Y1) TaxID=619300 RepID=G3AFT6_SPAPN|nr:major facilitator superfamily protein [Spathaspora passalidarum NRRL Y-27907]EGW35075.1 major facilitator superfamily protein [Spathaspora passalidarum NRRL Y-27907]
MLKSITFRWIVQIILTVLNIVGLLLFFRGFFPSKVVLPGHNEFSSVSPFLNRGKPQFSKFVLMVVDAMRSDFCYSDTHSNFHFLHELINQGHAIPFTAFSNPPTVTLPRLKGITTGGTPNFLDAIVNINDDKSDTSQGLNSQDSWVYQFLHAGKKINFFGDDTWLRLFPDQFSEVDGTNSFFVSDFTEVDHNVTRHLDNQLSGNNWDGLILHYLGLDHIGHKGGPESVYMKSKQEEMDQVLKRLYTYAEKSREDIVIVLMGDHGMNEIGNHGGSSIGETSAALTFISPKFKQPGLVAPVSNVSDFAYYNKISQIDLVPTLSTLLNIPIPKNSLGIIARPVLELWPEKARLPILLENCKQVMDLYIAKYDDRTEVVEKWESLKAESSIDKVYEFLSDIQGDMAASATNYDYSDLFSGIGIVFGVTIVTIIIFNFYFLRSGNNDARLVFFYQMLVVIYAIHFHGSSLIEEEHQLWYFFTSVSLVYLGFVYFKSSNLAYLTLIFAGIRIIRSWNNSGQKYSSKYNIGYYLLNSNSALLWTLITLTYFIVTLSTYAQGAFVNTFTFSNTNTLSGAQDFGNMLTFITLFVVASMSYSFKLMQFYLDGNVLPPVARSIFSWAVDSYGVKLAQLNDHDAKIQLAEVCVSLSRMTVSAISFVLFIRIIVGRLRGIKWGTATDVTNLITMYLMHQSRVENIPIFAVLLVIKFAWARFTVDLLKRKQTLNIDHDILTITIITLCLQNLTFFSMGNTNSLATVDLSNAYNGIKAYDIIPVGVLTFISNFSGPVFWSLSSLQMLFEPSKAAWDIFSKKPITKDSITDLIFFPKLKKMILWVKTLTSLLFYSVAGVNLLGSCLNLRFHLFIWSVFSPKLLYFGVWVVLINFLVDLVVAGLVLLVM